MLTFSVGKSMRFKTSMQRITRKVFIFTLVTLLPVYNETTMAATEAPDTVIEVASSIKDTVLDIWTNFVGHIPFMASGLAVLLITRLAAAFLSRIFERLQLAGDVIQMDLFHAKIGS
jgi:hypothetical protein